MAETQQSNAPYAIRKQPLTADYQFVPQNSVRKSPIPTRFEGTIPLNIPGVANGTAQR